MSYIVDDEGNPITDTNAFPVKLSGSKVQRAFAVTPSDTEDLPHPSTGIIIATAGNVKALLVGDSEPVVLPALSTGGFHPIEAIRIYESETTATGIVAAW